MKAGQRVVVLKGPREGAAGMVVKAKPAEAWVWLDDGEDDFFALGDLALEPAEAEYGRLYARWRELYQTCRDEGWKEMLHAEALEAEYACRDHLAAHPPRRAREGDAVTRVADRVEGRVTYTGDPLGRSCVVRWSDGRHESLPALASELASAHGVVVGPGG